MDASISPQALYRIFGRDAFSFALFYSNEPALRFELALGGSSIERFTQAFSRARELTDAALRDATSLVLVASYFGSGRPVRHLPVFRSLRECGIQLSHPRACWVEPYEDEGEQRTFIAFAVERSALVGILWGALATSLGIQPRLLCHVYIADLENGILVHPYDDRGMDVIGPNRQRLSDLFHRFPEYLLDYDRDRMEAFFGSAPA